MKNGLFIIRWFPLAAVTTIIFLVMYAAIQQDMRQGANDPQIQLAEDAVSQLTHGDSAQTVITDSHTDTVSNLGPYLIIFNETGKPVAASGKYTDSSPTPPMGVFDYARSHPEHRFTWQPDPYTRDAVVLIHYSGDTPDTSRFVLAGRSLREVEQREQKLSGQIGLGWLLALIISLIFCWISDLSDRKFKS